MSQHDMVIADQSHTDFRADVNAALLALVGLNSGATEPSTKYAYMHWADTTTGLLKIRNAANDAWITICSLAAFHATAAEVLAGAIATKIVNPSVMNAELVKNLKPVVNASVNKLDIFTKSSGAVPDANNIISVAIPDGNGYTFRSRAEAYLSGTSQFILTNTTAYWGAVSGTDKIKLHPYAIWDADGGIVFALSRYSGFRKVPVTVTVGDDDYFLLESGSTYTRVATDFCVCLGDIFANYNTGNNPDWTIYQASDDPELAPQVGWSLESDYGYQKNLTTSLVQGSNIAEYSCISIVAKQSGKYYAIGNVTVNCSDGGTDMRAIIKTGSANYGNAVQISYGGAAGSNAAGTSIGHVTSIIKVNAGDTIHLGVSLNGTSGNRSIYGDNEIVGGTNLTFMRLD